MKLIDKSAVVAEIEKIYAEEKAIFDEQCRGGYEPSPSPAVVCMKMEHLLSFINTLEVKEVDIDEAARKWEDKVYLEKGRQDEYGTPHVPFSEIGNAFMEGAKFILKAQKGE